MKNAADNRFLISAFFLAALTLSGCDTFFTDTKEKPLKGERISILQLQQDIVPTQELRNVPITLPDEWVNKFWPQTGGYSSHSMGQLALGRDLKKVWDASIGSGGGRRDPLIAQPVVAEGTVFTIDTDGDVTAFDLVTGKKKWRVSSVAQGEESGGALGGGLAYASGKIYVTNGYKQLVCLDPATGAMVWRSVILSPARAAPTVDGDRIYLITLDNRLMVFSAVDGTPLWDYAGVAETTNLLGSVSPAVNASGVVFPMSSGEIFALRVENGQPVWEDNLSAVHRTGALSAISDIRGQPVIDKGVVYAASYSGRMVAIDEVSGQRLWQREIGSAEMPWAAGDAVFVISTDQQLIALTRSAGDIHWITQLPRFEDDNKEKPVVWTGAILAGERLILASSQGDMVEINPQDGKLLKRTRLPGNVMIAPLVADNTLIFLTQQGTLVAYR